MEKKQTNTKQKREWGAENASLGGATVLKNMIREGFSEMLILEQGLKKMKEQAMQKSGAGVGGGQGKEEPGQRPQGGKEAWHFPVESGQSRQRVGMRSGRRRGRCSIGADRTELGKP